MATSLVKCVHLITVCLCVLLSAGNNIYIASLLTVNPPFVFVMEQEGDMPATLEGFLPDLMREIGKKLSIDFRLVLDPFNTRADVIDPLLNGEADIVAPVTITMEREKKVDFTKPFLSSGIVPVMKKLEKRRSSEQLFSVLQPFETEVWLLLAFCFVVVGIFLHLIYRFNPRERKETSSDEDEDFDILGSFLFALSCITWQGYKRAPRSIGGRILAGFWWMFAVFVITSYVAKLVIFWSALSSAQSARVQDRFLNDLVADSHQYTFSAVRPSTEFDFFMHSNLAVYKNVFAKMSSDGSSVSSVREGIDNARRDKSFVFFANSLTAQWFTSQTPCDLTTVGKLLTSTGFGLALRQGSSFRNQLTLTILELQETGQIQKLFSKWWENRAECAPPPPRNEVSKSPEVRVTGGGPLEMMEFGGAFILLFVGVVLAVVVSLAEFLWIRLRQKKVTEERKEEGAAMIDTSTETAKV